MTIKYTNRLSPSKSHLCYAVDEIPEKEPSSPLKAAMWRVSKDLENEFGMGPFSVWDAYEKVLGKKYKLTYSDTLKLMRDGEGFGFLEKTTIK